MSSGRRVAKADPKNVNFSLSKTEIYTSALPSPAQIRQIDEVYPGAAKILFDELKAQSEHRREMERMVIGRGSQRETLGLVFGFIIAVLAVGGGVYLISAGHQLAGFGIFFTTAATLVGLFVRQRYLIDKERTSRLKRPH